jgi:hypothetical protein
VTRFAHIDLARTRNASMCVRSRVSIQAAPIFGYPFEAYRRDFMN